LATATSRARLSRNQLSHARDFTVLATPALSRQANKLSREDK
jgi:hypothetical protein